MKAIFFCMILFERGILFVINDPVRFYILLTWHVFTERRESVRINGNEGVVSRNV